MINSRFTQTHSSQENVNKDKEKQFLRKRKRAQNINNIQYQQTYQETLLLEVKFYSHGKTILQNNLEACN